MGNYDDDMDVEFEVVGVRIWLPHFIPHTSPWDHREPFVLKLRACYHCLI